MSFNDFMLYKNVNLRIKRFWNCGRVLQLPEPEEHASLDGRRTRGGCKQVDGGRQNRPGKGS